MAELLIGEQPVIRLAAPSSGVVGPRFSYIDIAPGRAMMLLQARADLPRRGPTDLIWSPPLNEAAARLAKDKNAAFAFGGALLAPFANRITGHYDAESGTIITTIDGRGVRLPANGGGTREGAIPYAIHGLILDTPASNIVTGVDGDTAFADASIAAGDFDGRWPGKFDLRIRWSVSPLLIDLKVTAENTGSQAAPIGLGWHPYFALPSGDRANARLHIPARSRIEVGDYDEVLPTGRVLPLNGTRYDLSPDRGAALGDLYLDDCFTDLARDADGRVSMTLVDVAARYGLRLSSPFPVNAVQTYAPPDKPFVVIEPQFNLANPYAAIWRGKETGMAMTEPGESVEYGVRMSLFQP